MKYSIETMQNIVEKKVKHYKSDFYDYDIRTIGRMWNNTAFIWIVRDCGTFIAGLANDIKSELRKKVVKDNARFLVEYYAGPEYKNTVSFYLVKKGDFIKKISLEKALEITK